MLFLAVLAVFFLGEGAGATRLETVRPHSAAGSYAQLLKKEKDAEQADDGDDRKELFHEFRKFHEDSGGSAVEDRPEYRLSSEIWQDIFGMIPDNEKPPSPEEKGGGMSCRGRFAHPAAVFT